MIRYAITDGGRFGADFAARREGLLHDAARWAAEGVEYVQLREKDLTAVELVEVAQSMMRIFRESGGTTNLLINTDADVVREANADGLHLTGSQSEMSVVNARSMFDREIVLSVSCHSIDEVRRDGDADLILFGPVFEKRVEGNVVVEGVGIEALREACVAAGATKVLALGGVDASNASACLDAGAAGVAAIRMFAR